jgi:hypothetical protein
MSTFSMSQGVGKKNPEFEVRILGRWCAIEVKTPKLIQHGRIVLPEIGSLAFGFPKSLSKGRKPPCPETTP